MNDVSRPPRATEPIRLSEEPDFAVGELRIRPSLREIETANRKAQLEPRVMQVFVALAQANGAVVSREELIQRCWDGRIVGEAAINRCISMLREVSECSAAFRIETIPRVGYRLIAAAEAKKLPDRAGSMSATRIMAHPVNRYVVALAAGAVLAGAALFTFYEGRPHPAPVVHSPVTQQQASIAVLPFKNLSSDRDAGYLAAGVQDEILTRLAKIGSLRVISRTSTDEFANGNLNLPTIARKLGVGNVVEGNVQKSGNRIRINVQLIRAASDDHVWAEDYDRSLEDVLSVESEVAMSVAAALAAKVTAGERKEIAARPTANAHAYDLYLRGLVFAHKTDEASLQTAAQLLGEATRLDPKFALAWAWLARTEAYLHFGDDPATVRRGAAHDALMKALALQPDLAEAQVARGFYLYYAEMNYPAAERELKLVQARWPNNAQALEALGLVLRREGKWNESRDVFARLVVLDPLVPVHRVVLASLVAPPEALRVYDDALKLWPDNGWLLASKARLYQNMGQLEEAAGVLKDVHTAPDDTATFFVIWNQFWLERQFEKGAAFFRGLIGQERQNPGPSFAALRLALGDFLRMAGDQKGARVSYSQALDYILKGLKVHPNNPDLLQPLPLVYAGLGDRNRAMSTADRTVELFRSSGDTLDGTAAQGIRQQVIFGMGTPEAAIAEIERAIKSGSLSVTALRLDPMFDRLRIEPRFQRLLKHDAQSGVY